jgi:hypothetical protein
MFNESDKNKTQALLKYMHELAERDGCNQKKGPIPVVCENYKMTGRKAIYFTSTTGRFVFVLKFSLIIALIT